MTKTKNLKRLLIITGLFFAASVLSDVFVNVYIFRLESNYEAVVTYLLSTYVVVPFIFYFSGFLGMKMDRVSIYKLGILFFILFYLIVLLLRKNVINYLVPVGALKGIAMGFYWFGFHVLTFDYTSTNNRDSFYAHFNIIVRASAMVAPLVAGFIIARFTNLTGYYVIFLCSAVLYLAAVILSTPLKSTPIKKIYKIKDLVFTKNKRWGRTMTAYFALAGKDAIAMFLIAILVYRETGNEFTLGKFLLLVSVLSILTSYLMSKFSRPFNRHRYVLAGSALYFGAAFLIVYDINFITLVLYGTLAAVSDALFKIPLSAHALDIMSLDSNAEERKMEYIVARDIPIAAGRIVTLTMFVFLLRGLGTDGIKTIILFISTLPFVIYWAMYKKQAKI